VHNNAFLFLEKEARAGHDARDDTGRGLVFGSSIDRSIGRVHLEEKKREKKEGGKKKG